MAVTNSERVAMVHYMRVTLIFVAAFGVTLSFGYDDIFMLAMALMTAAVNLADDEGGVRAADPIRTGQPALVNSR